MAFEAVRQRLSGNPATPPRLVTNAELAQRQIAVEKSLAFRIEKAAFGIFGITLCTSQYPKSGEVDERGWTHDDYTAFFNA